MLQAVLMGHPAQDIFHTVGVPRKVLEMPYTKMPPLTPDD